MGHHAAEAAEAPMGASHGLAVLDIGFDIGAAVVYTTAALDGVEIEIRRAGADWDGTHTAVRRRFAGGPDTSPVHAALFDHLHADRYDLRVRGGGPTDPVRSIDVAGGQVVEVHFPG
jgi:hypothetical protein